MTCRVEGQRWKDVHRAQTLGSPAVTIPLSPEALDAAVEAESFTGVLTIDVGDKRTLERCEGFANRALGVPNTPSTRISAASGNKGFTALVIMRLVEVGKLGLGDLVRPILGDDLPLIDDAVTIEHLLTHTSGIGDYLDEDGDGEIDDYVFSLPLHVLGRDRGVPARPRRLPTEVPARRAILLLQRRIHGARARRRARQRPRLP